MLRRHWLPALLFALALSAGTTILACRAEYAPLTDLAAFYASMAACPTPAPTTCRS